MCKKDDVGDIIRIFELDNYTLVKGLSFSTFSVSLKNWILNGGKLMQVKTESFGNVVMCVQKTIIQKCSSIDTIRIHYVCDDAYWRENHLSYLFLLLSFLKKMKLKTEISYLESGADA